MALPILAAPAVWVVALFAVLGMAGVWKFSVNQGWAAAELSANGTGLLKFACVMMMVLPAIGAAWAFGRVAVRNGLTWRWPLVGLRDLRRVHRRRRARHSLVDAARQEPVDAQPGFWAGFEGHAVSDREIRRPPGCGRLGVDSRDAARRKRRSLRETPVVDRRFVAVAREGNSCLSSGQAVIGFASDSAR